jgi:hypothetical protein
MQYPSPQPARRIARTEQDRAPNLPTDRPHPTGPRLPFFFVYRTWSARATDFFLFFFGRFFFHFSLADFFPFSRGLLSDGLLRFFLFLWPLSDGTNGYCFLIFGR